MFRNITLPLFLGLMAVLLVPQIQADTLSVAINSGAWIQNPDSTQGRLLLSFDIPTELQGAEVTFAELLVPLTSSIPDSSVLAVECHPLLVSWSSEEVAWEDVGDTLSSEVINDGTQYATSSEGSQVAYFDITNIIKSWQDSSLANNGLILYYDSATLPYFTYKRGESAPFATVRFDYTH
ncbi:MAG TPA: hypothetical protein DEO84_06780 [candidate division Zixibacteria bacterium]|nr:hypothetical protein [candidate division Zixibacteria bacterium]